MEERDIDMKKFNLKKVILLVVVLYVGFIFVNQQIIMFRQHRDIQKYTAELNDIEAKYEKLQEEYKLSQDDDYIERIAREKLGLIKEGEQTVLPSK